MSTGPRKLCTIEWAVPCTLLVEQMPLTCVPGAGHDVQSGPKSPGRVTLTCGAYHSQRRLNPLSPYSSAAPRIWARVRMLPWPGSTIQVERQLGLELSAMSCCVLHGPHEFVSADAAGASPTTPSPVT